MKIVKLKMTLTLSDSLHVFFIFMEDISMKLIFITCMRAKFVIFQNDVIELHLTQFKKYKLKCNILLQHTFKHFNFNFQTGHSTNFVTWIEIPSRERTIYRSSLVSETNAQIKFCDQDYWVKAGVACFCSLRY